MEREKEEWWSRSLDHHDMGGPSPYVIGPGKEFLRDRWGGWDGIDAVDLGCYDARNILVFLTEKHASVTHHPRDGACKPVVYGIDIPPAVAAVTKAQKKYPGVKFRLAPSDRLPLPDGITYAALDWRRLHNLTAPGEFPRAILENNRILTTDGVLLVAVRGARQRGDRSSPQLITSSNGAGGERHDLHFSEWGWRMAAGVAGFECVAFAEVEESFLICGKQSSARYLVAHCVKRMTIEPWQREVALATLANLIPAR